jgi:hypothetical protein
VGAVTAPHVLYAFVWFRPLDWDRWFGDEAVAAFHFFAILGKGKVEWVGQFLDRSLQLELIIAGMCRFSGCGDPFLVKISDERFCANLIHSRTLVVTRSFLVGTWSGTNLAIHEVR